MNLSFGPRCQVIGPFGTVTAKTEGGPSSTAVLQYWRLVLVSGLFVQALGLISESGLILIIQIWRFLSTYLWYIKSLSGLDLHVLKSVLRSLSQLMPSRRQHVSLPQSVLSMKIFQLHSYSHSARSHKWKENNLTCDVFEDWKTRHQWTKALWFLKESFSSCVCVFVLASQHFKQCLLNVPYHERSTNEQFSINNNMHHRCDFNLSWYEHLFYKRLQCLCPLQVPSFTFGSFSSEQKTNALNRVKLLQHLFEGWKRNSFCSRSTVWVPVATGDMFNCGHFSRCLISSPTATVKRQTWWTSTALWLIEVNYYKQSPPYFLVQQCANTKVTLAATLNVPEVHVRHHVNGCLRGKCLWSTYTVHCFRETSPDEILSATITAIPAGHCSCKMNFALWKQFHLCLHSSCCSTEVKQLFRQWNKMQKVTHIFWQYWSPHLAGYLFFVCKSPPLRSTSNSGS